MESGISSYNACNVLFISLGITRCEVIDTFSPGVVLAILNLVRGQSSEEFWYKYTICRGLIRLPESESPSCTADD